MSTCYVSIHEISKMSIDEPYKLENCNSYVRKLSIYDDEGKRIAEITLFSLNVEDLVIQEDSAT